MKRLLKTCLNTSGFLRYLQSFASAGVAILRYHSVHDRPEDYANSIGSGIIHSSELFEKQMEFLARKYSPVSMDDVFLFLQEGKALPNRSIVVTFDDGFVDNYEVAKPILDRFGIPATFYVTVSSIESPLPPWYVRLRHAFFTTSECRWLYQESERELPLKDIETKNFALVSACKKIAMLTGATQNNAVTSIERQLQVAPYTPTPGIMLTWDQVKRLHTSGHIVGSHTLTHPNLAYIEDETVLHEELTFSRELIEKHLDAPIFHFSYPSPMLEPHWTEQTTDACLRAGYRTATTCTPGKVRSGDNPLAIKRVWVPFSMHEFKWCLDCTLLGRQM